MVNIMENKPKFKPNPKLKLMDQVRQVLRYHHYSFRTEQTYCDWIVRFIKFHGYQKHPKDMGKSEADLDAGYGDVYLPEALARKYRNASKEYRWQYVFPAKKLSRDPRSDTFRRHHVFESGLQKAVKIAVDRAGITKRLGTHSFRHYAELGISATPSPPICSKTA
jgi:hypothetical protein